MTEELKRELYNYITKQCSAVSINMEHRLVYHYDQMEKVAEFIYNLEEKRIAELKETIETLKIQLKCSADEINRLEDKLEI